VRLDWIMLDNRIIKVSFFDKCYSHVSLSSSFLSFVFKGQERDKVAS
jgi:hypothetical protein